MRQLIQAGQWSRLMEQDGLRAARRAGDAFVGFEEGEPAFPPTFKAPCGCAPMLPCCHATVLLL